MGVHGELADGALQRKIRRKRKDMVMMLFFDHKVGDGPLEVNDLGTILAYIDHNWDSVEPQTLPF